MNRIHLASSLTTPRIDCQFEQATLHLQRLLWARNQDQTCRAAKYSLYSVGDAGAIRTPRPALPVLPRCGPVLPSSRPSSAREWRCMLGNLVRPARVQYSMSAWRSIIMTGVHATRRVTTTLHCMLVGKMLANTLPLSHPTPWRSILYPSPSHQFATSHSFSCSSLSSSYPCRLSAL